MKTNKKKLIRAVTVSMSVGFYEPMVEELQQEGYEVVSVSSPGPELIGSYLLVNLSNSLKVVESALTT